MKTLTVTFLALASMAAALQPRPAQVVPCWSSYFETEQINDGDELPYDTFPDWETGQAEMARIDALDADEYDALFNPVVKEYCRTHLFLGVECGPCANPNSCAKWFVNTGIESRAVHRALPGGTTEIFFRVEGDYDIELLCLPCVTTPIVEE